MNIVLEYCARQRCSYKLTMDTTVLILYYFHNDKGEHTIGALSKPEKLRYFHSRDVSTQHYLAPISINHRASHTTEKHLRNEKYMPVQARWLLRQAKIVNARVREEVLTPMAILGLYSFLFASL